MRLGSVVGCGVFVIAACSDGGATRSAATDTTATIEPTVQVLDIESARAAALDIRADGCGPRVGFGTASMIDDRLAVTAAHVVAGADDIVAIHDDEVEVAADVVYFDPEQDLAVLRLERPVGTPGTIRAAEAVAGEDGVIVLPRQVGARFDVTVVEVSIVRTVDISTTDIYLDAAVVRPGFEIEGDIDPGDSGALVIVPGGGVGVVWAKSNQRENRAWAVDLPAVVLDADARGDLVTVDAVDTGRCIR